MKTTAETPRKARTETPTVEWNKTAIKKLQPSDEKQVFRVADRTGLRVEITPNKVGKDGSIIHGRKTFRYVVRFDDKPLYITLKHFESDDAGEFLRWTNQMFFGENVHLTKTVDESLTVIQEQLRKGINPNVTVQERRGSETIADIFERYTTRFRERIKKGEVRQKSLDDALSIWNNHIKVQLGDKRAGEITDEEVSAYLDALLARTSYAVHNKAFKLLRAVYNYAIKTAKIKSIKINPFATTEKLTDVERDRRLSMDELARLRDALHAEKPIYRDCVMMLLLTGQRKHTVLSMEWKEIDAANAVWNIPRSKFKSKKPHAVPLSPAAMDILTRRSAEAVPGQRFVFPSAQSASGHVVEKSGAGSFWRRIIKRAGLYSENSAETLRIHDLRRSIASFSIEQGSSIQAVSKLLGHSDISITSRLYAHMEIDQVRGQLVKTTDALLAEPGNRKLEILRDQIIALSSDDRAMLMEMIKEFQSEV